MKIRESCTYITIIAVTDLCITQCIVDYTSCSHCMYSTQSYIKRSRNDQCQFYCQCSTSLIMCIQVQSTELHLTCEYFHLSSSAEIVPTLYEYSVYLTLYNSGPLRYNAIISKTESYSAIKLKFRRIRLIWMVVISTTKRWIRCINGVCRWTQSKYTSFPPPPSMRSLNFQSLQLPL